jgi:hypothetical protein
MVMMMMMMMMIYKDTMTSPEKDSQGRDLAPFFFCAVMFGLTGDG